ncbi:hypothetical protein NM208_g17027 [Fusarium decemcellulare]|uniref:Uncharacterized protein n=1 Tax=Fusarium decemcellulare TaxID=57161 RepID=A0ACC1RAF0_9HYPO|nr:hypothetical protein NM208_g17027 [Fusarium decemcellulare]
MAMSDVAFYMFKVRQWLGLGGGMEDEMEKRMKDVAQDFGIELQHEVTNVARKYMVFLQLVGRLLIGGFSQPELFVPVSTSITTLPCAMSEVAPDGISAWHEDEKKVGDILMLFMLALQREQVEQTRRSVRLKRDVELTSTTTSPYLMDTWKDRQTQSERVETKGQKWVPRDWGSEGRVKVGFIPGGGQGSSNFSRAGHIAMLQLGTDGG